jgi:hypothetical protein
VSRTAWRVIFIAALVLLAVQMLVYRFPWDVDAQIIVGGLVVMVTTRLLRSRRS